jgi:hypothetical protein
MNSQNIALKKFVKYIKNMDLSNIPSTTLMNGNSLRKFKRESSITGNGRTVREVEEEN